MSALAEQPTATAWPLPTDFDPRPYQVEGVDRIERDRKLVLDIGLGGGKTTIALAAAERLGLTRVLVVCPSKVIAVWPDEVDDNAARSWVVWRGQVNGARGPLRNPSVALRCEALIEANKLALVQGRPFMAVVNYEAIVQKSMIDLLIGTPWDMVVCDESHKLAGAGAKTSRQTARIAERVRDRGGVVVLATGTLMPHSGLSLYGQFRTLDKSVLGSSWSSFKARYAKPRILRTLPDGTEIIHRTPKGEPIPDGVRPELQDELMAKVAPHILRVSQEDLDAQTGLVEPPPLLRTTQLDPDTRKVYDALERDMIAMVRDGVITAANAMVNVTRLAQVTSGYGKDATTGETIAISDPPEKARLLADELDDVDPQEPVVVFARFHHDLDQIRKVAETRGSRYGEISGRRADGLDGHRMHPDVDLVGVQPQSGGAGISLTRSRLGVFYSMDWSLANFDQCKRRLLRQGQTRHVAFPVLVVEDTIDVAVFYAVKRRRDVVRSLLDRLGGDRS